MFKEEDIVFSYTTKMAVEDGVLIPIPTFLSGAHGVKIPVYFNDSVWHIYVKTGSNSEVTADKIEPISRILEAFVPAAKKNPSVSTLKFDFLLPAPTWLTNSRNEKLNPNGSLTVTLKSVISAEDIDKPNPAIFIMLPWED